VSYSPPTSTGTRLRIVARGLNSPSPRLLRDVPEPSWFEPDMFEREMFEPNLFEPDLRECAVVEGNCEACSGPQGHTLGNIILGVAVIVGVSGGFWTGIGLLIAHLLR